MAKVYSAVLVGVDVHIVEIETVIGNGFSGINILGLSGDVLRDTRERIRSVLEVVGISLPAKRIVVNISPLTSLKLARSPLSELDFAIAACIVRALDAEKKIPLLFPLLEFFLGELTLSGKLRSLNKPILAYSLLGQKESLGENFSLSIAKQEEEEFQKMPALQFSCFQEWCSKRTHISSYANFEKEFFQSSSFGYGDNKPDRFVSFETFQDLFSLFSHNHFLLLAIIAASSGKHNILLAGEPGAGKTFAIQKMVELLPQLTPQEYLEQQRIYDDNIFSFRSEARPFRNPHHTTTCAALIGGASLKPGEVTLANNGVLFLDELAEFSRNTLESLREPLDTGFVCISRAAGVIHYPANFQLCAATNPCPCGFFLSETKSCRCNPSHRQKYLLKLSGPLLDRFALQITLKKTTANKLIDKPHSNVFLESISRIATDVSAQKNLYSNFVELQRENYLLSSQNTRESEAKPPFALALPTFSSASLSLRGNKLLTELSHTFLALFPEVKMTSEIWKNLLDFRNFENILHGDLY